MTDKNYTPLDITELKKNHLKKEKFMSYFRELPIQKLAADKIGVHETTVTRWKNADANFANQIMEARADWALKNVKSVRSKEWLLERIMRDHFQPPKVEVENSGTIEFVFKRKDASTNRLGTTTKAAEIPDSVRS